MPLLVLWQPPSDLQSHNPQGGAGTESEPETGTVQEPKAEPEPLRNRALLLKHS